MLSGIIMQEQNRVEKFEYRRRLFLKIDYGIDDRLILTGYNICIMHSVVVVVEGFFSLGLRFQGNIRIQNASNNTHPYE